MIYDTTPLAQDGFSRVMAEMYHEKASATTSVGFLSLFGANGSESRFINDATNVDIEIVKDNTVISALAKRGLDTGVNKKGEQGNRATYTSRVFPISKETGFITAEQAYTRATGENAFAPSNPYDRIRRIAASQFTTMINGGIWLAEQLAAQSILDGKMKTDEFGGEFDFKRNPDNTSNATTPWTEAASTPLQDIDGLCVKVDRNGKARPNLVLMDTQSYSALIRHADVKEIADNRGYSLFYAGEKTAPSIGSEYKRVLDGGFMARIYLTTESGYGVWIFTYNGHYTDSSKNVQDYMPKGTVMATSTMARFDRYFGPSDKLPEELSTNSIVDKVFGIDANLLLDGYNKGASAIIDPRQFKFFAYGGPRNSAIELEVQTAPIYACTQVDAVAVKKLTIV